jgi:hypothetical protein
MGEIMETTEELTKILKQWQDLNGLPHDCAHEQIHSDMLVSAEKLWLADFCKRWESAQKREV